MIHLKQHLQLLGQRVEDKVTGYTGVVTSISFDLYGCIQATVHAGIGDDGKPREQYWFDVNRLKVVEETPVMPRPVFDYSPEDVAKGYQGAAERPSSGFNKV